MPSHELASAAWVAERFEEADEAYPYGPHDYEVDQLQDYLDYHRFGFPLLASEEDPAF